MTPSSVLTISLTPDFGKNSVARIYINPALAVANRRHGSNGSITVSGESPTLR
jgi:hypothetical protein